MTDKKDLNHDCECLPLPREKINSKFVFGKQSEVDALLHSRLNLFAETPVFVQQHELNEMFGIIAGIENLVSLPKYQTYISKRENYRFTPSLSKGASKGLFMGYDFHLSDEGPKLIEVNTNAGGAFLVSHLLESLGDDILCGNQVYESIFSPENMDDLIVETFEKEWASSNSPKALERIVIVDLDPKAQYLYPEMLIAQKRLEDAGYKVDIVDPNALVFDGEFLRYKGEAIDLVYNRLTDFDLSEDQSRSLFEAYEKDAVVISPSPLHHALFADKKNLILFSNEGILKGFDLSEEHQRNLAKIPKTISLHAENAEEMWTKRKQYFFKPAAGFGSKATYRGSKITKKVWAQISDSNYVAQEFVKAPVRLINIDGESCRLKFDLRVYTYAGEAFALVARMYQGQTTNFRTPGGGFSPVIVNSEPKL